jgi:1-acyl-sn-glycerol-3-phosphate acyltransferase
MDTTAETAARPRAGGLRDTCRGLLRGARTLRVVVLYPLLLVSLFSGYGVFRLLLLVDTRDPARRARRLQRLTAGAFRLMFDGGRLMGLLRFDHRCLRASRPRGPCIVVANHPTFMDVAAITAALGGGCTVAKPAVFRRRTFRPLMVGMAHIEGSGAESFALGRVVDEAVERLGHGLSVIIFPEGTRSPAAGRLPFGRTAFEIACRARVPVYSIGVRCDPPWLTKEVGMLAPLHPAPRLTLEALATDDPADLDFDSRALKRRVEARYGRWPLALEPAAGPAVSGSAAPGAVR